MKNLARHYISGLLSICLLFLLLFLSFMSEASAATEYQPLVGIPGISDSGAKSIPEYINAVYILTITLGALFGVVRIAWAGVKYSLDEIVTHKKQAKEDIQGVLLGLAILLIPFIVLNTINPDLVNLNVLQNATPSSSQNIPTPTTEQLQAGDTLQFGAPQNVTPTPAVDPQATPALTPTTVGA